MFDLTTDDIVLTKEGILEKISQEQIFKFVFKKLPKEYEYIQSPFRKDNNPGCYFEYNAKGTLFFIDFANAKIKNGVDCRFVDCFSAIQLTYNLSFFEALSYIDKRIKKENIVKEDKRLDSSFLKSKKYKKKVQIIINPIEWEQKHIDFWKKYGISISSLKDNFVFPISEYLIINTRKGDLFYKVKDVCFAYTDFENDKKQLYRPYVKDKEKKFITSCNNNDIFGLRFLDYNSKELFITKSFKDCLVMRNCGFNTIGFLNEGMLPSTDILDKIFKNKEVVYIIFDNDEPGKRASKTITDKLRKLYPDIVFGRTNLPKGFGKDPSDIVKNKSEKYLKNLIHDYKRKYEQHKSKQH